jgi:uncharacterized protein (DUF1697 family)
MKTTVTAKTGYLALLRGINVGGNNVIKMSDLKKLFEEKGFSDVKTYIQSGNVLFADFQTDKTQLIKKIEEILFEKLNSKINIALLSFSDMKNILDNKPNDFGDETEKYRYDVIFLIEPLTAKDAIKEIKTREGVDEIYEGEKALYIKSLIEKLTKSRFSKITETSIYQHITIRNWNTTKKLYELMREEAEKNVRF